MYALLTVVILQGGDRFQSFTGVRAFQLNRLGSE